MNPLPRLLLLQRSFDQLLPLFTTIASLRTADDDIFCDSALSLGNLIRSLSLPLLVSFSHRGHGCFQKGAIGSMELIQLTRGDLT